MTNKIILDLCGGTGSWSKPYSDAGYEIWNITLPEYNILKTEFQESGIKFTNGGNTLIAPICNIYGILASPPCTHFSFARTNAKTPRDLRKGMEIVKKCEEIIRECQYRIGSDQQHKPPLRFWCLENPKGMLEWFLGKPAFEFNPYDFGDNYQKHTCLWGYFNIPDRYKILMDKKQKKLAYTNSQPLPKLDSGKLSNQARRAITPPGFAKAFFQANR